MNFQHQNVNPEWMSLTFPSFCRWCRIYAWASSLNIQVVSLYRSWTTRKISLFDPESVQFTPFHPKRILVVRFTAARTCALYSQSCIELYIFLTSIPHCWWRCTLKVTCPGHTINHPPVTHTVSVFEKVRHENYVINRISVLQSTVVCLW